MAENLPATIHPDSRRPQETGRLRRGLRTLALHRGATLGASLLLVVIFLALTAPLISTYDPAAQDHEALVASPGADHLFGTDSLGRDVFSRVVYGARVSVMVGIISVAVGLVLGVPLGMTAGYFGAPWDRLLGRVIDALLSFPPILLAMAIIGALGTDIYIAMLALGIVFAPVFARLARAQTLSIAQETYVTAALSLGAGPGRIVIRHIFPNIVGPLIVQATFAFSQAIIAEAALSFLGLGTQPPTASWGLMLDEGRRYLQDASWIALAPGAALSLTVLAVNFLGDGLRDVFDPTT